MTAVNRTLNSVLFCFAPQESVDLHAVGCLCVSYLAISCALLCLLFSTAPRREAVFTFFLMPSGAGCAERSEEKAGGSPERLPSINNARLAETLDYIATIYG